jgi:cobalt-zinc-cadmium efflux system outer membrane protein
MTTRAWPVSVLGLVMLAGGWLRAQEPPALPGKPLDAKGIHPVLGFQEGQQPKPRSQPVTVPPVLPGAGAPPLERIPRLTPENKEERNRIIDRIYPPLPPMGDGPRPVLPLEGKPLSLLDLQALGQRNSPLIRQAAADIEAARGAMIQAGLYPNPTIGYEADTINQGNTPGQQGGLISQVIKTGNKLQLARAAAEMDVLNAQVALRRAQSDLNTRIRTGYFAVLTALENIRVTEALTRFTSELYKLQVDRVRAGQAAPYEPLQLRIFALQIHASLIQSRNRYLAAWRRLAADLGMAEMPPTVLAGQADMPGPDFAYQPLLERVLASHTDVQTTINALEKARINLRIAQVAPIPDVTAQVVVQKDFTTPPFATTCNVLLSIPFPIYDRNQGGKIQAQGALGRASEDIQRARNDLTGRLAEAFERYMNYRAQLDFYKQFMLTDQVRVYQGTYDRYDQDPDSASFADVIDAQQRLLTTITSYTATLTTYWQAVVDVTDLLQVEDPFAPIGMPGQPCPPAPAMLPAPPSSAPPAPPMPPAPGTPSVVQTNVKKSGVPVAPGTKGQ